MNTSKKVTAGILFSAMASSLFAQYPVIPDSIKQRAEAEQAEIDRKSDLAWEKALPVVISEAPKGRPYRPWASKPEDLI